VLNFSTEHHPRFIYRGQSMTRKQTVGPVSTVDGAEKNTGESSITSIARAFRLLESLVNAEGGGLCSVKELSKDLNLAPSTIHRLLSTLRELGYVNQDRPSGRYEASVRVAFLGNSVLQRFRLAERVAPLMRDISVETGESVSLVVLQDKSGVLLEKVEGTKPMQVSQSFRNVPLYCTAAGKVILSTRNEDEIEAYIAATPFTPVTQYTIRTATELRKELRSVKERGYAIDLEEYSLGARCVAVAFFVGNGTPASLSISSLAARLPDRRIKQIAVTMQKLIETHGFRLAKNLAPA
jgi:DNA-binding IclR family transcriptional regulator